MMPFSKIWYTILFVLCSGLSAFGQSDRIYRPVMGFKFNPLATLNHTPGIEFGLEHTISPKSTLHLGGSYLSDFGVSINKDFEGYKLLGEYRYYQPFERYHPNTFLAFQFNFKQTFASGRTFVDRANGNYQELTEVKVTNTTFEFMGAYGRVFPLTSWLSFDLLIAVGAKRLTLSSDNITENNTFDLFAPGLLSFTVNTPGTGWYPLFRPQVKFNVELFRKQ